LTGINSAQVKVYKNKLDFDGKEEPLGLHSVIADLGTSKEEGLVVVVPISATPWKLFGQKKRTAVFPAPGRWSRHQKAVSKSSHSSRCLHGHLSQQPGQAALQLTRSHWQMGEIWNTTLMALPARPPSSSSMGSSQPAGCGLAQSATTCSWSCPRVPTELAPCRLCSMYCTFADDSLTTSK
jgi:hypothetical protein